MRENTNQVRLLPRKTHRQRTLREELTVEPDCQVFHSLDYWGNRVAHFTIMRPHSELLIESLVEVETTPSPNLSRGYAPEPVETFGLQEFLLHTPLTAPIGGFGPLGQAVDDLQAASASLPAFLDALCAHLRQTLRYEPGTTTVETTVADVLRQGGGVCQDFAHLFISICRHRGIPARYCGGYHYLGPQAKVHENHAWAEAHLPGYGWVGWDPANGIRTGEHHVLIAAGRDYADVAPVRGSYWGPPGADLQVELEMWEL